MARGGSAARAALYPRPRELVRRASAGLEHRPRARAHGVRSLARRQASAVAPDDGSRRKAAAARARPASRLRERVPRQRTPTVLVAGAGTVGLAVAALLATGRCADRLRVQVVESRPLPRWRAEDTDLRVYALSRASQRLLDALGVWQRVAAARAS